MLYVREGKAIREGFGDPFPPLPGCLLNPSHGFATSFATFAKPEDDLAKKKHFRAGWTGLEPAASGVTGRRYNQLNYHPVTSVYRLPSLSLLSKKYQRLIVDSPSTDPAG
jgi:hypothetical protein